MNLIIDLNLMPEDVAVFSGELPAGVFDLPEEDSARAGSPLAYELKARKGIDLLSVTGSISATFQMECGRCLARFPYQVLIEDYELEIPLENQSLIDLTEELREDILLLLPNFPRCEESNLEPRTCPALGRFQTVESSDDPIAPGEEDAAKDEANSGPDKVWDALDTFKPLK